MMRLGDVLIDVRTPHEYSAGHILGAINIPIDRLATADLPGGQLITTCSMGGRGGRAAGMLAAGGRTAFSLAGGIKAWQAAGLPMTTGPEP
jgi:rhodanese-related sulfurtransferase